MRYHIGRIAEDGYITFDSNSFPSYAAAMGHLGRELALDTSPCFKWDNATQKIVPIKKRKEARIYLDIGSIEASDIQVAIQTDPMLRSIYELGWQRSTC